MIWIATLCLLAIAAWLFFNALNEMRWVQAHSHDETVASDEGLLPSFTAMTRSIAPAAGSGEESLLNRASRKVTHASEDISERVVNKAKSAASSLSQTRLAANQDGVLGKVVGKVSGGLDTLEKKVSQRKNATKKAPENMATRVTPDEVVADANVQSAAVAEDAVK